MGIQLDFTKVETALVQLAKKSQGSVIHKALNSGAEIMEKEIKDQITSKGLRDTDALYDSIGISKKVINGTKSFVRVGIQRGHYNRKNKTPRETTIYGYVQEYGGKRQQGKHWMSTARDNALEDSRNAIIKTLVRELGL